MLQCMVEFVKICKWINDETKINMRVMGFWNVYTWLFYHCVCTLYMVSRMGYKSTNCFRIDKIASYKPIFNHANDNQIGDIVNMETMFNKTTAIEEGRETIETHGHIFTIEKIIIMIIIWFDSIRFIAMKNGQIFFMVLFNDDFQFNIINITNNDIKQLQINFISLLFAL